MYINSSGSVVDYAAGAGAQGAEGDDLKAHRPKPVFFWTNGEVMKWLKRHCQEYYELYGNVFLENEITGRSLIRINEQTLMRMGIENAEHRDQIARIILKLKLKSDFIELKDLERKGQTTNNGTANPNANTNTSGGSGPAKTNRVASFHR